jgi:hypothetical protein
MVDAGVLSPADAETHPEAGVLARAIGQLATVEVDIGAWFKLKSGDEILLCSDGLSGEADDVEISDVMRRDANPQRLADRLVALALRKGGHDNVTVQVIRYGNRPVPFDWKPIRYQAATLAILALAFAAAIPLIDSRMEARLSKQLSALEAQTRTLGARADEWRSASDGKLVALEEEVASLDGKVKELAAIAQTAPALPPPSVARKKKRQSNAGRVAPPGVPHDGAKAPDEKQASAEPISMTTDARDH